MTLVMQFLQKVPPSLNVVVSAVSHVSVQTLQSTVSVFILSVADDIVYSLLALIVDHK